MGINQIKEELFFVGPAVEDVSLDFPVLRYRDGEDPETWGAILLSLPSSMG